MKGCLPILRRTGFVPIALAALLAAGSPAAAGDPTAAGAAADRGQSLDDALDLVGSVFDAQEAMDLVEAIDPFYRVRGNEGYIRSLEACYLVLEDAGFEDPGPRDGVRDTVEFKDYGPVRPAWTPYSASLAIISPDVGSLHSFETEAGPERTFLCVNSFPTRPEGVVAPLVRYEHGKPAESYAGTVVYGTLPSETLFARAVQQGGALGVISSYLPDYNEPDMYRDSIRYSTIPYDLERKGFGLNVSPSKRDVIERLLGGGMVYVKVVVHSRFTDARSRTLVATIGGTDPHAGAVAVVSHLDEPGANDNASGVAATTAMAAGYKRALRDGLLPRPRRSLTFLLGTEFECSREWLRTTTSKVDMSLIVDMVGQDPELNGAEPLVERMPDPGAIWDRPPLDVHSEWGRGDVRESDLVGHFLNDYVMAAMRLRARQTDWPVRSNPYEGGSDHESFLERGIPSALIWHFTDPFYHTSLDRVDEVSASEMTNVAVGTLALLHHFAQAGFGRAEEVLDIVMDAARVRLATEAETARAYLSAPAMAEDAARRALVMDRERTILVAWSHWYREAVLSLEDFEPGIGQSEARQRLESRIDDALTELRQLERQAVESIEE